jgi:hypothetical protein
MDHIFSLLIFLSLLSSTFAQFQFFEQMFSGNAHHHRQHQQQQQQNVASDSAWYRQTYDGGKIFPAAYHLFSYIFFDASTLHAI